VAGAYTVKVVDLDGSSFGDVDNAAVSNLRWELNGPGGCDITLTTTDSDAALFQFGREVQVYRDGTILFWGPIVRIQAGLRTTTWQCAGLLWYFTRRYFGRADRVNQLSNGDFEDGETGWSFQGGVTHSIDTGIKISGAQSLELAGGTADHNTYAHQTYTHNQSHPAGDYMTIACYVYVPTSGYAGGALDDRGLFVVHKQAGTGDVIAVTPASAAAINDATPKDQWLAFEVGLPAVMDNDTLEVRLYPPHGTAYYDLVTLTGMESLSFGWPDPAGADVADIVAGIVLYAQDLGPFTHGKSDLNIDTAGAATSVMKSIAYQHAEHRNIADAILEYVRNGIVDIDIEITTTTRTFTTYSPRKGSLYGTTLVLDTNLADMTWSSDGANAASSVVVLGPGDGPDRPEGGASDPAAFGGLTLEHIEQASDDVLIGELDTRAQAILDVLARPQILEVTGYPAGFIGGVDTGDTVTVDFAHGHVDVDGTYRIVAMSINTKTDQLTMTLNAEP